MKALLQAGVLVVLLFTVGWITMTNTAANEVHPHAKALKNPDGSWKYTNRLANQTSPYLLQHAHNPVDWQPWGPEAFEAARERNVPIFLSVGYATCYWCHVMERQVFENPEIAKQMNELFVCIKVDREERPDVDDIYMTATQLMTRSGGWPMSVFLTPPGAAGDDDPGLKPFWAGTYIPPTAQHGRPGFPEVLEALSNAWGEQRAEVIEQAKQLALAVSEAMTKQGEPGPVSADSISASTHQLLNMYDPEHGGFGQAPKFPQPAYLDFLLTIYRNNPADPLWQVIGHTLEQMAHGGMYDQIAGGFHRYSTDERWLVPHFEKMLYDNAQLVELYTRAVELKPTDANAALYERIIRETCAYVLREMTDPTGAFWSAQDAEVNAREGGSYVWTDDQVRATINDAALADLALKMYGLSKGTNFQDPHDDSAEPANVLYLPKPLSTLSAEVGTGMTALLDSRRQINTALKAKRDQRDQPITDDKVILSWNGMMIAGLADAGRVLDEPSYIRAAANAADAILKHMATEGDGLRRTMRNGEAKIPAFLEDYVWFVHGLIALHHAQPDEPKWLDLATRFTHAATARFAAERGGYYDTLADQQDLFVRVRGTYDGAVPSANGRMIHNLLSLYELTGDTAWLDLAERDLLSFSESLGNSGAGMVQMQGALLRALEAAPARFADQPIPADSATGQEKPVTAQLSPDIRMTEGQADFTVTLDIGKSYHVNSNSPSMPNLIPTVLTLHEADGYEMAVEYPEPETHTYAFSDQPLSVYQGKVTFNITLRRLPDTEAVLPDTAALVLDYQACTDMACLQPATIRLPLAISDE